MLDIKFIRENGEIIKMAAQKKHIDFDVDKLIEVDKKRIEFSQKLDELRAKQNIVSTQIPNLNGEEKQNKINEMTLVKEEIKKIEPDFEKIMNE